MSEDVQKTSEGAEANLKVNITVWSVFNNLQFCFVFAKHRAYLLSYSWRIGCKHVICFCIAFSWCVNQFDCWKVRSRFSFCCNSVYFFTICRSLIHVI